MRNTVIHYAYRDAANYKQAGSWTVTGPAVRTDIEKLLATLDEGEFFVPVSVGIPSLINDLTEDDHPFHTITGINATNGDADDPRTLAELAREGADEVVARLVPDRADGAD